MKCKNCGGTLMVRRSHERVDGTKRRVRVCDTCGEKTPTLEMPTSEYRTLIQGDMLATGLVSELEKTIWVLERKLMDIKRLSRDTNIGGRWSEVQI